MPDSEILEPIPTKRIFYLMILMAILGAIVFGKLVYVQLFQNKLYLEKANAQQTRKFDITARRGQIYVNDGNGAIYPIALNQQLFLLAADPKFVKDSADTAGKLSKYLPGDEGAGLESKLNNKDNRYLVIKKSLLSADAEEIKKLKLPGISLYPQDGRNYPEGELFAHITG